MNSKYCFIAMPIRQRGTAEYDYFKALYTDVLKPELEALGYIVTRADEVQESGAITKDIIVNLAKADLVIADLTDLNPNVFYELGVRHSLRGQGTVMLLDTLRTKDIPFDLGSYRVIQFQGKLEGIGELRKTLSSFVQQMRKGEIEKRDNPVHDVIPELPINALEASRGSIEGKLRKKIEELESTLSAYVTRYGIQEETKTLKIEDPLEVVSNALSEVSEGNYPPHLLQRAEDAAQQGNVKEFLEILMNVFEQKTIGFNSSQYLRLATLSFSLSLDQVTNAIYEQARMKYPADLTLRVQQLSYYANSELPEYRERVRQEVLGELKIKINENGTVTIPESISPDLENLIATALDAYHKDQLHQQALAITEALSNKFPNKMIIARNHARALQLVGDQEGSIKWYRRAIWSEQGDALSANWLGVYMGLVNRFVDAAEAHLLSCVLSPDTALYFGNVAELLGLIVRTNYIADVISQSRRIPQDLESSLVDIVKQALIAAVSCPIINQSDVALCAGAASRLEIDFNQILQLRNIQARSVVDPSLKLMNYIERISFAQSVYDSFRSELTINTPAEHS